ncbi:MAG: glycosyltransferase family 4 protein [Deltaproteobacteria bacterium]|nr:glycosyltransferase family 4 protein [Deltaproteobacteria bacterium]
MSSPPSRRRRVALVTTHPVQYHGPWFRRLAANAGVELQVLFACDHGTKPSFDAGFNATFAWDRLLTDGYRHEFLPNVHPDPGPHGFWNRTNPVLWSRIHPREFDAVIVFGWGFASALLAVAAARAHGVPVVMHSESNLGPYTRPPWKTAARKAMLSALFSQCDAFLSVGSKGHEMYLAYGAEPEQVFIANYCADNDFFEGERERLAPERPALRSALGVEDERPVLVCSGKLFPDKEPLELLEAFAIVRRERPARLVFLGDGPLRRDVERVARERGVGDDVVITGFRNQRELGAAYAAADMMVFPSKRETWGIVVNEAMLFGLPVICSDQVTAHHDLVVPGVTGDTYPSGDSVALASILSKRLADPTTLRRMGARGLERIRGWNYDVATQHTIEAIEFAVTRARGRGAAVA